MLKYMFIQVQKRTFEFNKSSSLTTTLNLTSTTILLLLTTTQYPFYRKYFYYCHKNMESPITRSTVKIIYMQSNSTYHFWISYCYRFRSKISAAKQFPSMQSFLNHRSNQPHLNWHLVLLLYLFSHLTKVVWHLQKPNNHRSKLGCPWAGSQSQSALALQAKCLKNQEDKTNPRHRHCSWFDWWNISIAINSE